jgi:hypothetical protein
VSDVATLRSAIAGTAAIVLRLKASASRNRDFIENLLGAFVLGFVRGA